MEKKLSICIPTMNRAKDLNNLLSIITKELNGIEDIEVCVSDNNSKDSTKQICAFYKQLFPIVYKNTDKSISYDNNIKEVLKLATGEWVWFCGDDDTINEGAIKKTLNTLKTIRSNALYIPTRQESSMFVGFIGCIAVRRKEALKFINKPKNILDYFMHTYLFAECSRTGFEIATYNGVTFGAMNVNQTYQDTLHRYILCSEHSFDLKKNYPWLNVRTTITDFRTHIVRASILAECPENEWIAKTDFELLLRICDSEEQKVALRIFEILRKLPLISHGLILLYRIHRTCKKNKNGLHRGEMNRKLFYEICETQNRVKEKLVKEAKKE